MTTESPGAWCAACRQPAEAGELLLCRNILTHEEFALHRPGYRPQCFGWLRQPASVVQIRLFDERAAHRFDEEHTEAGQDVLSRQIARAEQSALVMARRLAVTATDEPEERPERQYDRSTRRWVA